MTVRVLDEVCALHVLTLAAQHGLHSADAIYGAVTHAAGSMLFTLGNEHLRGNFGGGCKMAEQYSETDKLQYEVKKLIAEEKNLSRPFWWQPASWITLATLGLSLVGNTIQYSSAERRQR